MSIYNIAKKIKPKCPYCNRTIDLTEFCKELFYHMLVEIKEGKKITIQGIGAFRSRIKEPQKIEFPGGVAKYSDRRVVLGFKSSLTARKFLNDEEGKYDSFFNNRR